MNDNQAETSFMEIEPDDDNSASASQVLIVEEVASSDFENEDALEQAIQPDEYEEASSANNSDDEVDEDSDIANDIRRLSCQDEPYGLTEEQVSRYIRKKKQWKARLFKRRHSQSSDDEAHIIDSNNVDAYEMGKVDRRLRRRTDDADKESPKFEHSSANLEVSNPTDPMQVEDYP